MTKGKCVRCYTVYHWDGAPTLKNMTCPRCGLPLSRTTHLLKGFSHKWREGNGHGRMWSDAKAS